MYKRLIIISMMAASVLAMGGTGARASVIGDLVLVLDESGSVDSTEFALQREIGLSIINSLAFGPDNIQVGIATYTSAPRTIINLTANQADAVNALNGIVPVGGGPNMYAPAIDLGANILFGTNSRAAVPKVMVFFGEGPDGGSDFVTSAATAAAAGITTFTVGFGNCDSACFANLLIVANGIAGHEFSATLDLAGIGALTDALTVGLTQEAAPSIVPEPGTIALLAFGIVAIGFVQVRRRVA